MKVLGIEFSGSKLHYVLLDSTGELEVTKVTSNSLSIGETRSANALRHFSSAVSTMLNSCVAEAIAIKAKPERGAMSAGAAALKMEAILLSLCTEPVQFISGAQVNKQPEPTGVPKYLYPAYKSAMALLKQ